ncbi:MAG: adenosylmethionine--8-amino-7-oxononanoate transaminase [Phycisphaerae bacterium]|jgi:adenosylmethionine-8-amino-7-oxononanoate transaminase|nr:adenosylmethionine--8-amino-7-oxononanoate transaminase [Phycisphaerae bacterium]
MNSWIKRDLKVNWHPYTQMKDLETDPPIVIDRTRGIKLYDENNNYYYDTISSWWCNIHGHNHPALKKAMKKQLDRFEHVMFAGFTHSPAIELSEKLLALAPGKLSRVFYSDNGSTAVETAMKMSYQFRCNLGQSGKKYFVSLDQGYHGDTLGTMGLSGVDQFHDVFTPIVKPSFKIPTPYCYRCPYKKTYPTCKLSCADAFEQLLEKKSESITAVVIEPLILGAAGMIIYPPAYLKRIADLAHRYDVHLIIDEVATGFGRTGKMFSCEYIKNIKPDFICLSKGITSGYLPLAATLTTEKIYRTFYADFDKNKTLYHGHTYTANPLGCAAALASLEVFEKEQTLAHVNELAPWFHAELDQFRDLPHVGDVRHLGFVGVLELVADKQTKAPFPTAKRVGKEIYRRGLEYHLLLRPLGDILYFYLPLCTSRKELQTILNSTYKVLRCTLNE